MNDLLNRNLDITEQIASLKTIDRLYGLQIGSTNTIKNNFKILMIIILLM